MFSHDKTHGIWGNLLSKKSCHQVTVQHSDTLRVMFGYTQTANFSLDPAVETNPPVHMLCFNNMKSEARKAAPFPRNGLNSWIRLFKFMHFCAQKPSSTWPWPHHLDLTTLTWRSGRRNLEKAPTLPPWPCYALVCIGLWYALVLCVWKHGLIRSSPKKLDGLHIGWCFTINKKMMIEAWIEYDQPIWCSGPEMWPIPR